MNAFDNGVLANGLLVDLYDKNGVNNKPQLVQNGITSQIPSDCAWGTREVFFHSANETGQVSYLTVKIAGTDTNGNPGIWQNLYNGNDWVGWTRVATTSDLQHIIFADTSISLSNDKYGSITLDIPYQKVVSINLSYADNVYTYAPVLSYKNVNGKTNINIVCNAANTNTYGIRVSYLK